LIDQRYALQYIAAYTELRTAIHITNYIFLHGEVKDLIDQGMTMNRLKRNTTATHYITLHHAAACYNTLQHAATRCKQVVVAQPTNLD